MGYSKEVYEKAWQILDQRRQNSEFVLTSNRKEAYRKVPQLAEIQRDMIKTGTSITQVVVSDPENAPRHIQKLAETNQALHRCREELLSANGYPKDFLALQHHCRRCADTGYIATKMCDCFEKLLKDQAFASLSQLSSGSPSTFSQFELSYYPNAPGSDGVVPRKRMDEIYHFCVEYANRFSIDAPSLLMMGKTGLGKTHLSLAIAREVTQRGFGVVYTPVQRLMDRLESQKFSYDQGDKEAYAQHISSVMECDLLVLDDLGTEFITSFTTSVLYNIINSRLIEGRPTIINTNLEPIGLESVYSQRMASRLAFGYKILRFCGEDIRFIKRQKRFKGR